jgi:hypothetical protein
MKLQTTGLSQPAQNNTENTSGHPWLLRQEKQTLPNTELVRSGSQLNISMQRHKLKSRIERLSFGHLIKLMCCVVALNISQVAALNRALNCGSQWHDAELQVPVLFVFRQVAYRLLAPQPVSAQLLECTWMDHETVEHIEVIK